MARQNAAALRKYDTTKYRCPAASRKRRHGTSNNRCPASTVGGITTKYHCSTVHQKRTHGTSREWSHGYVWIVVGSMCLSVEDMGHRNAAHNMSQPQLAHVINVPLSCWVAWNKLTTIPRVIRGPVSSNLHQYNILFQEFSMQYLHELVYEIFVIEINELTRSAFPCEFSNII